LVCPESGTFVGSVRSGTRYWFCCFASKTSREELRSSSWRSADSGKLDEVSGPTVLVFERIPLSEVRKRASERQQRLLEWFFGSKIEELVEEKEKISGSVVSEGKLCPLHEDDVSSDEDVSEESVSDEEAMEVEEEDMDEEEGLPAIDTAGDSDSGPRGTC